MKDLAPNIVRQRLLIEAISGKEHVNEDDIRIFLKELAAFLDLRTYGEPIIHSPSGDGKEDNQGFDAFIPLIDSGIALYYWSSSKFLSIVLYTCKIFDNSKACSFTQDFFITKEIENRPF